MEFQLSQAIGSVKMAMIETAEKAEKRRLNMYKEQIQCKPKCTACCSRMLPITIAEALVMHEYLLKKKQWIEVREKAKEQAKMAKNANMVTWTKMNIKCPVLSEEGLCRAHLVRPALCSVHFVKSDPRACDPWATSNYRYNPVDMNDLNDSFMKRVSSIIDSYGIFNLKMPIPVALLLAERIQVQSDMDLQKTVSLLFNELR